MPELVNAVGGGDLHLELDLVSLHESINGAIVRYEPEHWPGLYVRFCKGSPAVLIFRTGKYNIAGADSLASLYETKDEFLDRLERLGINADDATFEVRNLVSMDDFHRELDLEALAVSLGLENTEYQPEQFPGLLYSQPSTAGVFLIFRSGKVILTGNSDLDRISQAFNELFERLQSLFNG